MIPYRVNAISEQTAAVYRANFENKELVFDDINNVNRSQLSFTELLWAMRI